MKRYLFFLLILFVFTLLSHPVYSQEANYAEELISKALTSKLHEEKRWLLFGYYEKQMFSGIKSSVNSKFFFISPNGNVDPEAELKATIHSFFQEITLAQETANGRCFFPARFKWLQAQLQIDKSKLPRVTCERLEEWMNALKPGGLSVVFSSYYMGNPSSMFGHNLYKIHTIGNEENEILDYGVNYAADSNDSNAIAYVYKGLVGGYNGSFSLFPYYLKVNEYNDLEIRDLWEYKLNLNDEQLEYYMFHLWELRLVTFPYYFFTQNCAYSLLPALEIANTDWKLSERASRWIAPPPDSIRIYLETQGLVAKRNYRPSLYSKIQQRVYAMKEEERKIFYEIISDPTEYKIIEDKFSKTLILDSALDYFQYRKMTEKAKPEEENIYKKYLNDRSQLGESKEIKNPIQWSTPPDFSHPPSRVGISGGYGDLGNFYEFKYRLAYHDLMNRDKGHAPNSEINFLNFAIRKYQNGNYRLDHANILSLFSLSPYNPITRTLSYKFDLGVDSVIKKNDYTKETNQLYFLNYQDPNLANLGIFYWNDLQSRDKYQKIHPANLDGAFGFTFQKEHDPFWKKFAVSFLAGAKAQVHSDFIGRFRTGPSLIFQVLADFDTFKVQFFLAHYHYQITGNANDYSANLRFRYSIFKNNEIRLELNNQLYYREFNLSYNYLF